MWCVVVFGVSGRESCVSWSVVCYYVGANGFSWVLLAVQVWKCAGGKRCVDLETQKDGKKLTPKGREAKVTSTVCRVSAVTDG